MPPPFTPYAYIQCPCSDSAPSVNASTREAAGDSSDPAANNDQRGGQSDEDDRTFDPRSTRANYSLYPLEHLLYCEDCHQIRCPRCVAEEIVTYYCPNCLFEVPTSNLKSEGNRCTRSCFQCPVCIAPLSVTTLDTPSSTDDGTPHPPQIVLSCSYCQWSSTEIGIKFEKPNGLYGQLLKLRNGGTERLTPRERREKRKQLASPIQSGSAEDSGEQSQTAAGKTRKSDKNVDEHHLDLEAQFANLRHFYQRQIAETTGGGIGGLSSIGDLGFGSPASINRIMSMYTSGLSGVGSRSDRKGQSKVRTMREARNDDEGFVPANLDETAAISQLHDGIRKYGASDNYGTDADTDFEIPPWDVTASSEQRAAQSIHIGEGHLHGRERFLEDLRPIPFLLRTKRSKRCPICRHIISKPEAKSSNNRFRIRLVAGSYIPSLTIRPLVNPPAPAPTSRSAPAAPPAPALLEPLTPVQFILTFKNPIFDSVKVTLATPSTTPGRFSSRVTLLCPQFEIDPNIEAWDDALREDRGGSGSGRNRRGEDGQPHQATPGKIWERGRNWVSTVLEVVPPSLNLDLLAMSNKPIVGQEGEEDRKKVDLSPLREDEDIVEIPMFVRIEWETDAAQDGVGVSAGKGKDAKEKREMAYWCVLGVGRIRQN